MVGKGFALRSELKDSSLVQVGGTITRKLKPKGTIQLILQVSRVDIVKDKVISVDDMRKGELLALKN